MDTGAPIVISLLLIAHSFLIVSSKSGAPKLIPLQVADSYQEGEDLVVICTASGDREGLRYQWLKDDKILVSDQNHIDISNDLLASRLTMHNLTIADAGHYACLAKNNVGQDKASTKLVVNAELKWLIVPNDTTSSVGQEVVLECSAQGQPKPTIKWVRSLNDSQSIISEEQSTNKLVISAVKIDDAGLYECIATNGHEDVLRKIARLDVKVILQDCKSVNNDLEMKSETY